MYAPLRYSHLNRIALKSEILPSKARAGNFSQVGISKIGTILGKGVKHGY
jgi:hypothetical protein